MGGVASNHVGLPRISRLRLWIRMRFFIPALERAFKLIAALALIGAIVVPMGWGYQQRQRARTWQDTACVYRLREVTRGTNVLVAIERRGNACAVLHQLGVVMDDGRGGIR